MLNKIIVIGGGPVGLSFACSLAKTALQIIVLEKQKENKLKEPVYDAREIALTHLSKKILISLGVWRNIPDNAISLIKEAKVMDGNSSYALHFNCNDASEEALGYLLSNQLIRKVLYNRVKELSNIELRCDVAVETTETDDGEGRVILSNGEILRADLIVAADSRFSSARKNMGLSTSMHEFGRTTIVCKMKHELAHYNTAYECFRYNGTIAVLPLNNGHVSVVITIATNEANAILAMDDRQFNQYVQSQLNNTFGEMRLLSKRVSYPLIAVYANQFVANRFAVIGDAAVGMHPVTAHGFNFGMMGQYTLASEIKAALLQEKEFFSKELLMRYQAKHRLVTKPLYLATNAIVNLYTSDFILNKLARKVMLRLGNNFTFIKRIIMHKLAESTIDVS